MRSSRSSNPGRGGEMRSMIPSQCQGMTGRARAMCVIRLTHPNSSMSSASSRSSLSSAMTQSGALTTNESMLRTLLRMSAGEGTQVNLMRQLCGLVTGEFVSSCAQGKGGLQEFNRQLNTWFLQLGQTLAGFMRDLNRGGDMSSTYFWNSGTFPFMGGSGSSSSAGTGSVKGWNWMNETDSEPLVSPMSSSSSMDRGQEAAWAACEDREWPYKSRCVRQYLENQNMQDGGASSSLGSQTNSY
jgi:hypothetical protein